MRTPGPSRGNSLGQAVRQAREDQGWTQTELAERTGLSRPTVARIEAGHDVSMAALNQVARSLGLVLALVKNNA